MHKRKLIGFAGLSLSLLLGLGTPEVQAGTLTGRGGAGEAVVLAKGDIIINASTFPDSNFRNYIVEKVAGGDYVLSKAELEACTALSISGRSITSLKGIEHFTRLTFLDCSNNLIRTLDTAGLSELSVLYCDNNELSSLKLDTSARLEELVCYNNQLSTLVLRNHSHLKILKCYQNQLTNLEISSCSGLTGLYCQNNRLDTLELASQASLLYLNCGNNQLRELHTGNIPALVDLHCYKNQLSSLDLSDNTALEGLYCYSNRLTGLDLATNTALRYLDCRENLLKELDLSRNPELLHVNCDKNQLRILDSSSNTDLLSLYYSGNRMGNADISANTKLLSFSGRNQTILTESDSLDMLSYHEAFQKDRVESVQGLTLSETIFYFNEGKRTGNYNYHAGTVQNTPRKLSVSLRQPAMTIRGLIQPVTGSIPDTDSLTASYGETVYTIREILWSPAPAPAFLADTVYTVDLILAPSIDNEFTDQEYVVVEDTRIPAVLQEDGSLKISYTFPKTGEDPDNPTDPDTPTDPEDPTDPDIKKDFPFTDVPQIDGSWKYESVHYVYSHNIMNGISGTTLFQPDQPLTRAMFATVLYRMAGSPDVTFAKTFKDVKDPDAWYSKAILWASREKIVEGYSDGNYGINDNVTREQIAKMLYLYGENMGYDVSDRADLTHYSDTAKVSSWAVQCMKWAVAVEMINGKNKSDGTMYLDPGGDATRAECAAILMRFQNRYAQEQ